MEDFSLGAPLTVGHCQLELVTAHPTTRWTLQQLREAVGLEERYQYLLHDCDGIFAKHLDDSVTRLGVTVLKSPPQCPAASAICERVIGTIRRECLDWLIPLSALRLRSILRPGSPITTSLVRTWRWVRVFPIRPQGIATATIPNPATAARSGTPSAPSRSLADCIASISLRPSVRESIFAGDNAHARARAVGERCWGILR
jgi:hypothetical protein